MWKPAPSAISVVPIIRRKPSASITTLGLRRMKAASGPEAAIISPTATTTAAIMIGRWSVMPTAVSMLSMENTMSSTRICTITPAKLRDTWPEAARSSTS